MRILALDSSAGPASACVMEEDKLLAAVCQNVGLTHSQTLLPMVEDLLRNAGMDFGDLDGVAVTGGPGSFTGLRIGMAAAKGLCLGAGKKLCPVSTLKAMAYCVAALGRPICAVMDARRSQVYNALFLPRGERVERLTPDRAIGLPELLEELKNLETPPVLVGDGARLCYNGGSELGLPLVLPPPHLREQHAVGAALCMFREELPLLDPAEVSPRYLRLSQAERELEEKRKNKKQED